MKPHPGFICLILLILLAISGVSADPDYTCYNYDSQIFRTSVQTAVAADGQSIAVGGPDTGTISLFLPNGSLLWSYRTPENITSIALSSDGHYMAAATYFGNLYYFDSEGHLLWNISGLGCNNKVALSGNGLTGLVFNSGKRDIPDSDTVFNFDRSGTILWQKSVHSIASAAMSSDGKNTVIGTKGLYGNDALLFSDTGDLLWRERTHRDWVIYDVDLSDNGNTAAAVMDHGIFILNHDGKMLANITPKSLTRSVAVSPDGRYVVAGMQYYVLCLNRTGGKIWEYTQGDYIYHLAISDDGHNVVATSMNMVYYLDEKGTCLWKYPLAAKLDSISMSRNGQVITAGSYNDSFVILDKAGKVNVIDLKTIPGMPIPVVSPVPVRYVNSSKQVTTTDAINPKPAFISLVIPITAFSLCTLVLAKHRRRW